jgi:hypothetical protein
MAVISSSAAERVAENILSSNDELLSISVIDRKGNILLPNLKSILNEHLEKGKNWIKNMVELLLLQP